jgi:hypothetical protein
VNIQRIVSVIACFLVTGWLTGCRCGAPEVDGDTTAGGPTTGEVTADGAETGAVEEQSGVSPEVRALIEAGDANGIAADLEKRAGQLRELVAATEKGASDLEGSAESMTGRQTPVDPRDPAAVETLIASATALAEGADALSGQVENARQLVTDLRAESDTLYGRPASPADPSPDLSHSASPEAPATP